MTAKIWTGIRVAALSLALLFSSAAVAPVMAQDPVEVIDEDEDEGFDDWGLLGLLGLAGLLGLKGKDNREVRTTDRTGTAPR